MLVSLFAPFPVMQYPYKWSDETNALYYVLSRIGWAYSFMVFFFFIILGHSTILKNATQNWIVNTLGAMIWPIYLIAPLVYMNMYCTEDFANYMTNLTNSVMGMGAMCLSIFGSLFFLALILNPLNNLFKFAFSPCLRFKGKDDNWGTQSYRLITSKQ